MDPHGLALMGFGFVVARFGLFLERLQPLQGATPEQSYGLSLWFGTALTVAGILVNALPVGTIYA
jgi:putative membrane protein